MGGAVGVEGAAGGGVSEEGGGGQAGHEEHDAGVKWIGRRIYFYTKFTYRYKCF